MSESPHGSKFIELIRYLANHFLTDAQRKRIKNFIARVQLIPLKLLGIESLMQSQKDEISRLKARCVILEGKLNIAVYGMPRLPEDYRSVPIFPPVFPMTASVAVNFPRSSDLDEALMSLSVEENQDERRKFFLTLMSRPLLEKLDPKHALLFGESDSVFSSFLLERFTQLEMLHCVGQINEKPQIGDKGRLSWMETDPMTGLVALSGLRFDMIYCSSSYSWLSPLEQVNFVMKVKECLNSGGVAILVLPDLSDATVMQDLYWKDSKNLRPYSLSLVKQLFEYQSGLVEVVKFAGSKAESKIAVLYKK